MEPQKVQNFENKNLQVEVAFFPDCLTRFKIKAFPELLEEEYKKAIRTVNKEVSLPGFRKGKAPDSVILDHHKPVVEKEWKDSLVRTVINQALDLTRVYPYSQSAFRKVELSHLTKEEALVTCELETAPDVPHIEPTAVKIAAIESEETTEEEIQARIDEIRFRFAKWHDAQDRGVAEGDYVELALEIIEPEKKDLGNKLLFKFHEMAPWMQKAILGKKTGETVEAWSEKDPAGAPDAPFTASLVKIHIEKISVAELPEINEEFLKNIRVSSQDELLKRTRLQLEGEKNRKAFQKRFELLEKTLAEIYPFELPETYVNKDQMQAWEQAEIQKIADNTQLSQEEKEKQLAAIHEKVKKDIFNKARSELLLDRFFGDNKLSDPTEGELQQALLEHSLMSRDFERFQNDPEYAKRKRFFITRDMQHKLAAKTLLEQIDASQK